jgi:predicted aldo/keto reductase-like oxidoreductase
VQENRSGEHSILPTRILGKTNIRVPVLGFGTAACGIRRDIKNGVALYEQALKAGVNYFDAAPTETGYGRAQEQLRHFLPGRRKSVFLVTKCHTADGDTARRMLDANLKELGTDYADLVYVHSLGDLAPDRTMGKNGILSALLREKEAGRIRFIGLSGHSRPSRFRKVLSSEWADQIDVIMTAVNFADQHTYDFEGRVWPLAAKKNIGLVAMKVFGGADWKSKAMSNAMMPEDRRDMALRYALSLPRVALAVVGMATEDELRENLARVRAFTPLTEAERASLEAPGRALAKRWGAHFGAA